MLAQVALSLIHIVAGEGQRLQVFRQLQLTNLEYPALERQKTIRLRKFRKTLS
jgi:hypothetical protein